MRRLNRVFGTLALTLALAATSMQTTALAAEEDMTDTVAEANDEAVTAEVEKDEDTAEVSEEKEEEKDEDVTATVIEVEESDSDAEIVEEITGNQGGEPVALSLDDAQNGIQGDDQDDGSDETEDAYMYTSDTRVWPVVKHWQQSDVVIDASVGEDIQHYFSLILVGGYMPIFNGDEVENAWCTNLPEGLTLSKFLKNGNSDFTFGRFQITGSTLTAGNYEVTITIPKSELSDMDGYTISEDGLSAVIYINIDGVSVPVTVPVEDIVESTSSDGDSHSHKDKPVISEYDQFCNAVAAQVANAATNEAINVKTDKWVSFNKKVIDALAARPDVSVNLDFVYNNQEYQTVITAGGASALVEVENTASLVTNTLANGETVSVQEAVATTQTVGAPEYYGFLYVGSKFGMNTVAE